MKRIPPLYARTALQAVQLLETQQAWTPEDAWNAAILRQTDSEESQIKPCPRHAFLGLCSAGLVRGINPAPEKDEFNRNAEYAVKAVELLRQRPEELNEAKNLWLAVLETLNLRTGKRHNAQMDVVLALWSAGLIVSQESAVIN